jgi:hypothetical protein
MPLGALVLPPSCSACSAAFALPRAYGAAVFPLPCLAGNPSGGGGESSPSPSRSASPRSLGGERGQGLCYVGTFYTTLA